QCGTVDSWTLWVFAITVWPVALVAGANPPSPLSDFLSRWFPWFFSLPQDQQAFLEVAVPSTVLVLLWFRRQIWRWIHRPIYLGFPETPHRPQAGWVSSYWFKGCRVA